MNTNECSYLKSNQTGILPLNLVIVTSLFFLIFPNFSALASGNTPLARSPYAISCRKLLSAVASQTHREDSPFSHLRFSEELQALKGSPEPMGLLVSFISLETLDSRKIEKIKDEANVAGMRYLSDLGSQEPIQFGSEAGLLTTMAFTGTLESFKNFNESLKGLRLAFKLIRAKKELAPRKSLFEMVNTYSDISNLTNSFDGKSHKTILLTDTTSSMFVGAIDTETAEEFLKNHYPLLKEKNISSDKLKEDWSDIITSINKNASIIKVGSTFYLVSREILSSIQIDINFQYHVKEYFSEVLSSQLPAESTESITMTEFRYTPRILGTSIKFDETQPVVIIKRSYQPVLIALHPSAVFSNNADKLENLLTKAGMRPVL